MHVQEGPGPDSLAHRSRQELCILGREYLLIGHLQDRVGLPKATQVVGEEAQVQLSIDEWMGASPIYSRRMQQVLGFERQRRRDRLQEPPARHRRAPSVHGLPVQARPSRVRRVLARALRRAARCRALWREARQEDVLGHRGSDLRRHRGGDASVHEDASDPPASARSTGPTETASASGRTVVGRVYIDDEGTPYEQHPNLARMQETLVADDRDRAACRGPRARRLAGLQRALRSRASSSRTSATAHSWRCARRRPCRPTCSVVRCC